MEWLSANWPMIMGWIITVLLPALWGLYQQKGKLEAKYEEQREKCWGWCMNCGEEQMGHMADYGRDHREKDYRLTSGCCGEEMTQEISELPDQVYDDMYCRDCGEKFDKCECKGD